MRYLIYLVGFLVVFTVACGGGGDKKAAAPAETKAVEAPKVEAPKVEVPKAEEPKAEAKTDAVAAKPAALKGKDLFDEKGCSTCHFADTGTEREPYPTKQLLAALSADEFAKISIDGKPGTMMVAQELTKAEAKAIYEWIKKFKK